MSASALRGRTRSFRSTGTNRSAARVSRAAASRSGSMPLWSISAKEIDQSRDATTSSSMTGGAPA